MFQVFLLSDAASVIGVEIVSLRAAIASQIKMIIQAQLPLAFKDDRKLELIDEDYLADSFNQVTIVYVCSTIFSFDFLKETPA